MKMKPISKWPVIAAQGGNRKALNRVMAYHENFIYSECIKMHRKCEHRTGLTMDELLQEARVGLMKAIEKFNHRRKNTFLTYANWWIMAYIYRCVKKASKNSSRESHNLPEQADDEMLEKSDEGQQVADTEHRMMGQKMLQLIDRIPDPRYKKVMELRLEGQTLEVIGQQIGVSRERVRQIERAQVAKLREALAA